MLERGEGRSLSEVVQRRVTGPLGLGDTGFDAACRKLLVKPYADGKLDPVEIIDGMSVPLDIPGFKRAVTFSPSRTLDPQSYQSGGAGMVGTAGGILQLLDVILAGGAPLLRLETVRLMMQAHVGIDTKTQGSRHPSVGRSVWPLMVR